MLKSHDISGNILFEERQKFPNWLTILIAGIVVLTIAISFIVAMTTTGKERNDAWLGLAIGVPIEALVIILFQYVQLEKVVTSNGLYYRWKPWQRKFRVIEKESIKSFEVRKSPPLNYGIHWFPRYGWVHNASRGEGLQLYLFNRKKIFFSVFDITFFRKALEDLISVNRKRGMREF